jgi:hypothetical protein
MLECGGIERERLELGLDLALLDPRALQWIGAAVLQHIEANGPNVVAPSRSEVDVPLAVDSVDLRRPDVRGHLTGIVLFPDHVFGCRRQPGERSRST